MTELSRQKFNFRSIVYTAVIILLATGFILYVLFQARFLVAGPRVVLVDEPSSIQNSKTVHLRGQATNITKIQLNGRQIFTDKAGYFDEALVLENGYTIATIQATDRYGRETSVVKQFVYTPTSIIPQ